MCPQISGHGHSGTCWVADSPAVKSAFRCQYIEFHSLQVMTTARDRLKTLAQCGHCNNNISQSQLHIILCLNSRCSRRQGLTLTLEHISWKQVFARLQRQETVFIAKLWSLILRMFSWRRCVEAAWCRCLDTCSWILFYWRRYLKTAWHICLITCSVNEMKAFISKVSAYYISIWGSSTTWWIASRLCALHQKMTHIQD